MKTNEFTGIDLRTPRNVSLTGFYKRSFAFHTVKNRMPVILTQTIDVLVRNKENIVQQYGKESQEELKVVIGELSKLKYEIQTNKPLRTITSDASDVEFYNNYLTEQSIIVEAPTYINSRWLHTECFMYRKMREAFEQTHYLKNCDPFRFQKEETYFKALQAISQLGSFLQGMASTSESIEEDFVKLLKLNLWGNKCDLSLSCGTVKGTIDHLEILDQLDENILCDHSARVWDVISAQSSESQTVDIVLDNSGYELFTDLCLADFVVRNKLAKTMRFYVKTMPWFISDVTTSDFEWTLSQLKSSKSSALKKLGERWTNYVKNKVWTIEEHGYWTLPVSFKTMASVDPELYKKLGEAKLIIFKGDLNYRKLFGDKNWDPETPIEEALEGFYPGPLCTLRTLKADIICGLDKGVADLAEAKEKEWMTTGNFGVIQFCDKVVQID